jgi:hypothetical protein
MLVDKNIWQPSPIQEEDDNVQMLYDAVDVTGAQQQQAPLASANNFPPDHWIKPNNDEFPPPPLSPAMASEDDIWFSPLPAIHRLSSPATPSGPGQSTKQPLSHDQMEAMLAQFALRWRNFTHAINWKLTSSKIAWSVTWTSQRHLIAPCPCRLTT